MGLRGRMPTDDDVWQLGRRLRLADRQELEAVCDLPPHEAVLASCRASDPQFLRAHVDAAGRLVCIRGCSPVALGQAAPWLLATELLDEHWLALHRQARRELPRMLERYPLLSNVIDVRQQRVIAWLRRLGFRFGAEEIHCAGLAVVHFRLSADAQQQAA